MNLIDLQTKVNDAITNIQNSGGNPADYTVVLPTTITTVAKAATFGINTTSASQAPGTTYFVKGSGSQYVAELI